MGVSNSLSTSLEFTASASRVVDEDALACLIEKHKDLLGGVELLETLAGN
jgi:hypothetical protein